MTALCSLGWVGVFFLLGGGGFLICFCIPFPLFLIPFLNPFLTTALTRYPFRLMIVGSLGRFHLCGRLRHNIEIKLISNESGA